jgi:hypothetical protein
MVILAQDMASFHDKLPTDAVHALTAALTGEMEMMKQYGVVLKADEIQRRAMLENNLRSEKAITAAMTAQATFNLILEKSGKAVGDVARNQDTYTFQLKKAKAAIDEAAVALGEQLLPAATEVLVMFNEWARSTNSLNTAMSYTVEVIQFVHNGISGIILIGQGLVTAFATIFDFLVQGFQHLLNPISAIGQALVELGAIDNNPFDTLTQNLKEFQESTKAFAESSKQVFVDQYATIEKNNAGYERVKNKIKETAKAQEEHKKAADGNTGSIKDQTLALDKNAGAMGKQADATKNAVTAMVDMNVAAKGVENINGIWTQVAGSTESFSKSVKQASLDFSSFSTDASAEEFIKLKDAVNSAAKAVEEHAVILKTNATPEEKKYHEALLKLKNTAEENLENYDKTNKVVKEGADTRKKANEYIYSEATYVKNATGEWVEYTEAVRQAAAAKEAENSGGRAAKNNSEIGPGAGNFVGGGNLEYKTKTSGSFSVRGQLSEEQWAMLPQSEKDRLAKQALNMGSSYDYFNAGKLEKRFRAPDYQGQINSSAEHAFKFYQLQANQTSDMGRKAVNNTTINNNFTQQISRSDVVNIVEETSRLAARS